MAVDFFLALTNIKGEAQDATHKDSIDVIQWSWGMEQSGTTHMGPGAGSGKVNVNDITLTKYVDMATHDLLSHCATGKHIAEGTLTVRKAGENPLEYFVIKMKDIMITSYTTGGSEDGLDRVMETVRLNFAEYNVVYTSQKMDGTAGPKGEAGFNIPNNVKV